MFEAYTKYQTAKQIMLLNEVTLKKGLLTEDDLYRAYLESYKFTSNIENNSNQNNNTGLYQTSFFYFLTIILSILIATPFVNYFWEHFMGIRCLVPNNYLIWEATRPISDCGFCEGITSPLILPNVTQEEFSPYAYSSQPIIIKNATSHWPASKLLNYSFLKDLYMKTPGALDSFHDECQFLGFKSDFMTLNDVFNIPEKQLEFNEENPWYVGWSNCNPDILFELRKLYPRPHFIPKDAEMPNTDYVFLGYGQGASMHIDYIPRLMWQAQLKGNKTWILSPTPECDRKCSTFSFYVEPGDAVLVDTRVWYHGTYIAKGEFSLTIQSEYG